MADTFGRGPNGEMLYDPSKYDQWGVYMGDRAAPVKGVSTATPGFNQWDASQSFEQWLPQYAKSMLSRNFKGGIDPVTAKDGTPEYRDQVRRAQEQAQQVIDWGGNVGNMGVRAAKGAGLNTFNQYKDLAHPGKVTGRALQQAKEYYEKAKKQGGLGQAAVAEEETPAIGAEMQSGNAYAAPQYNPVDSWGGWSAVYGNNNGAPGNPAGLGQSPMSQPAALGTPASAMTSNQGLTAPATMPSVQPGAQPSLGVNPSGANPYNLTQGQSMARPNRRRRTGAGLGQPTTLGLGVTPTMGVG